MLSSEFRVDALAIEQSLLAPTHHVLDVNPPGMVCRLIRLDSDSYVRLRRVSVPIKPDYDFLLMLMAQAREKDIVLTFPQLYTVLKCLFGESSESYDHYKGSFAFPLYLHLKKGSQSYPYMLCIRDHKGSLEFDFYRITDLNDRQYVQNVYHEPLVEEFSREEMNAFVVHFYGFLKGYFSIVGKTQTQFFYRSIEACLAVYGCLDGEFFERVHEDEEEYRIAVKELQTRRGGSF
ncbi:MAG: hypothetical protein EOM03_18660 [Clostridia bacterium]|nr:hypothetical protein [Clostridia bacterium]